MERVRAKRYEWTPVVRRLRCKPSVKLVAFAAATYGNADGGSIFPGIVRLANVTGLDDRTVKIALAELRKLGLMARIFEGSTCGRRGGMADEHVLTLPDDPAVLSLLPADESDRERDDKRAAARQADAKRKRRRKEQVISVPEQVTSATGTGDLSSRIPVSQITPPVHGPIHVHVDEDHHSARIERAHAAARARIETFNDYAARRRESEDLHDDEIAADYVRGVLGDDLDAMEESTVTGMIESGSHPNAIINTVLRDRGESEADYRAAQTFLLDLADDVRRAYQAAADEHAAAHFPDTGHRWRIIFAARLAQRRVAS